MVVKKKVSQTKRNEDKKAAGKKSGARKETGKTKVQSNFPDGQVSTLVSKSIDLAEASLSLGLNLVKKISDSLPSDMAGKVEFLKDAFMNAGGYREPESASDESVSAKRHSEPEHSGHFTGVVNRLPLFPGSPFTISFSINNDAPDQPKKVSVCLSELAGEITGITLPPSACTIKPTSIEIAPMDFDKFVISGAIPIDAKGDTYKGYIDVSGQEKMIIPLRLVVTSQD